MKRNRPDIGRNNIPAARRLPKRHRYRLKRRLYSINSMVKGEVPKGPQASANPGAESAPGAGGPGVAEMGQLIQMRGKIRQLESALEKAKTGGGESGEKDALIEQLKKEVESKEKAFQDAKKVVEDARNQVARSRQEMEQQRKRLQKDREEIQKNAAEAILGKLLPVFDNFSIAVEKVDQPDFSADNMVQGIVMIQRDMQGILDQAGFRQMNAVGEAFDPKLHEAVAAEKDESQQDGVVLKVMRPGYVLNEKVLRPAMVIVNRLSEDGGTRPRLDNPSEVRTPIPEGAVRLPPRKPTPLPSDVADDLRPRTPAPGSNDPIPPMKRRKASEKGINPLDQARQMLDTNFDPEH